MIDSAQTTSPRRAQLSSATFFYGARPVNITDSLRDNAPKWADELLTEEDIEDGLAKLCRDLSWLSGRTLAPVDFYTRGTLKVADPTKDPRLDQEAIAALPDYLKVPVLAFFGDGFNVSWKLLA